LIAEPAAPVSKDALIEAAWPCFALEESNLAVQIAGAQMQRIPLFWAPFVRTRAPKGESSRTRSSHLQVSILAALLDHLVSIRDRGRHIDIEYPGRL
jgi:hypothetical protein